MRRQDRIDQFLTKNKSVTGEQLMRKFGLSWAEAEAIRRAHSPEKADQSHSKVFGRVRWLKNIFENERKTIFTLVALAAVVRAGYAFFLWRDAALAVPIMDAEYYVQWAQAILKSGWIGNRIFFTEPLYAYFLAVWLGLFGAVGTSIALLVQFCLGALVPAILYCIGRRVFDRPTGTVAGVMSALYGPFVFYEGLLLKTSLEVFSLSLFVLVLLKAFDRKQPKPFFFAGVLLGATVLIKGNNLAFLPIILGLLFWLRTVVRAVRWRLAAAFFFGVVLCLVPVTLRNYVVGHDFVPTNYSIGLALYQGNWWGGDGSTAEVPRFLRPHPKYEEADAIGMAEAYAGKSLKPSEVSRFWMGKSFQEIIATPGHFITTLGNKLVLIAHPIEFSDNYSYSFYRSSIPVLWFLFPQWLIFPFTSLGLILLVWRFRMVTEEKKIPQLLILLMLAAYVGILLLTTVNSRYRIPLMPFGILLGAYAIVSLGYFFRFRAATGLLWAGSFLSVLFLLMLVGLFSPRYALMDANAYHALGYAALEQGQYGEARKWFERTIALDPRYGWAYGNLMLVALIEGDIPGAKGYLQTLITLRSDDLSNYDRLKLLRSLESAAPEEMREQAKAYLMKSVTPEYNADFNEANRFLALGDRTSAEAALERSLSRNSDDEATLIALASLKKEKGEPMKTVEYLRRAVTVNPYNFIARYNLANAYIATQNFSQVVVLLKDIYDFTPELGDTWYNYAVALAKLGKFDEAVPITQAYVERYRNDLSKKEKVAVFEKAIEASKQKGLEGLLKKNGQN